MIYRLLITTIVLFPVLACTGPKSSTLKNLRNTEIEIEKNNVDPVKFDTVRKSYQEFIDTAPNTHPHYKEALNRLADLEMAEGDKKTMNGSEAPRSSSNLPTPVSKDVNAQENYLKAIAFYEHLLETDPNAPKVDWTIYQLSRAYEQSGRLEKAAETMARLVKNFPKSEYYIEAQFRLGELRFTLQEFELAEPAYFSVIRLGRNSSYYERSLYKYGWSLFKQERYDESLDAFFSTLKVLPLKYDSYERLVLKDLNRLDQEMVNDIFRAINLSFSYNGGIDAANRYLNKNRYGSFEYEIFSRLGEYFTGSARVKDAADAYEAFVVRQPLHPLAPEFQLKRIETYANGGFQTLAIDARKEFANRFGKDSTFWRKSANEERRLYLAQLKKILIELSQYYHASAQRTKNPSDYNEAIKWYVQLATAFPGEETIEQKFLLADLLYQIGRYYDAIKIYEQIAYELPRSEKSADSGYSALLGYDKLIEIDRQRKQQWISDQVKSALRFVAWFPSDMRTVSLQVKVAEQLFELKRYDEVLGLLGPVIEKADRQDKSLLSSAYVVLGHIAFERKNYTAAQESYEKALKLGKPTAKMVSLIGERIAVASYKRAETASQQGKTEEAISAFLQTAKVSTNEDIRAQAEYDAATGYIQVQNWSKGVELLEQFRSSYPKHKLIGSVTEKLAYSYDKLNRFDKAAIETKRLIAFDDDKENKRKLLWTAAELYEKAANRELSIATYKEYLTRYDSPAIFKLEAFAKIAAYEKERGNAEKYIELQRQLVEFYKSSSDGKSERAKYLAAGAAFDLAVVSRKQYTDLPITIPLKRSLKKKQEFMKSALKDFDDVAAYGVAEYTTASTFEVAKIYQHLSRALLSSEKPRGLSKDELEQYDLMLEEQAYPFEEKAIEIYDINVRRIRDGLYDDWVRKSIAALAEMQPARYAKAEKYESQVDRLY